MLQELKSKQARRAVVLATLSSLGLILLLLSFLRRFGHRLPESFSSLADALLVSLFSTLAAGSLFALLAIYLLRKEKPLSTVDVTDPPTTRSLHADALNRTDCWWHHGHIGRWVRVAAMPRLRERARSENRRIEVRLIVLDPNDSRLCSTYASYRQGLAFRDDHLRSERDVRAEIFATIIRAAQFDAEPGGLSVRVFLSNHFSLFRTDINSKCVFQTREDPRVPAIVYRAESDTPTAATFYHTARNDFEYALLFCCEAPRAPIPATPLTSDDLCRFLQATGLDENPTDELLTEIATRLARSTHPYE